MQKFFLTLFFIAISYFLFAQKADVAVKGTVKGDDGKPLSKATVMLASIGFKDTLSTITNSKGVYTFQHVKKGKATLIISSVGFKKFSDVFDYSNVETEQTNNDIVMTIGSNTLETVTVESSKIAIKEDTVSYRIDSTMFRKNDNVEEVLKKLPGVEVDKDGKVIAQGKEITKVKVNGKEFFGGDVKTATRQLNADMVDKIQIVDDYGDQAAFTGVKDGDPTKTMNIQLKKDKNKGVFGNATVGAGTEQRYANSLSLNIFNNNQQISILGNLNNTNASAFDFSRIPGGMGAIAGSAMRSFGGSNGFGNNDGVGDTKTIGVNYRDEWGTKVSVYGSYSFSNKNNTILNNLYQQTSTKSVDTSLYNKQNTTDNSITNNHRFSLNVEYKIDSFNYIKINPSVTFKKLSDDYLSVSNYFNNPSLPLSNGINRDINNSTTPNFTGNLLFNHRFAKKGRTLSLNFSGANSITNNNDDIINNTDYYNNGNYFFTKNLYQNVIQQNNNYNYGVTASFNELITKKKGIEFNYAYNRKFVGNDKETFDVTNSMALQIDSLTNIYNNIYTTNKFGVNYRITEKKYNYSLGFAVQPATIQSNTLTGSKLNYTQNIINYFPVIRFVYNFSKSRSFNINYNGSTNQPTFQQSQPIQDQSNIQNIIIGNPNLKPEFSNSFSMRYNNFDVIGGNVFFGNLSTSFIQDKIVNNISIDKFGRQQTTYLNTNGYYNVNAFYTISKPIQNRKYVFNYGGVLNYNNNVSFLNEAKNTIHNWVITQRFSLDYKLKKWLEASGGTIFSLNDSKSSLIENSNTSIKAWTVTHSSRLFFKHDINFNYDMEKVFNQGYSTNVGSNPFIINATLEKQFLTNKNASIKLQAFDLLNENTNVSRSVNANSGTITDTRTNRLQRYFMLSLVYRFNKFSGTSKAGPGFQQGTPMPGMNRGNGEIRFGGPGF